MSENLHLVFSKPPADISDEAYNQWYDYHLGEILVVPGFVSARRYRLDTVKGDWTPSGHRYLSAYELEGEPKEVMAELDKEVASGRMKLPEWFPRITFASFNCYAHGNPAGARLWHGCSRLDAHCVVDARSARNGNPHRSAHTRRNDRAGHRRLLEERRQRSDQYHPGLHSTRGWNQPHLPVLRKHQCRILG